jgi:hypothetical protein
MKGLLAYLGAVACVVLVSGVVLALNFKGSRDALAIQVSGVIVLVVQLVAFVIVRQLGSRKAMAGVGLSAILRLFILVSYAALIGTFVPVPAAAALLSMAIFFFITSLMEPLFLRL